jgi:hypothetical protein
VLQKPAIVVVDFEVVMPTLHSSLERTRNTGKDNCGRVDLGTAPEHQHLCGHNFVTEQKSLDPSSSIIAYMLIHCFSHGG